MLQVEHLHSVDKVWAGVEIVGPRLLQATQAKDAALGHGTAGKGPAAGQAWVSGPGTGLQIKGLKSSHWELALAAPCQWNWGTWEGSPSWGGPGRPFFYQVAEPLPLPAPATHTQLCAYQSMDQPRRSIGAGLWFSSLSRATESASEQP